MTGIGPRLKEERLRLKFSQHALGAVGGVETNAQANYESGARFPRADYLSRVAARGVDVTYVVTGLRLVDCEFTDEQAHSRPVQGIQNQRSTDRMDNLVARLQNNLHAITTDLYQIGRLAQNRADASRDPDTYGQLAGIKGEAEAIALATLRLIFVTSRLN